MNEKREVPLELQSGIDPMGMNVGQYLFARAGVPPEELKNCLEWAFGPLLIDEMSVEVLFTFWNERHSDIFKVNDDEHLLDVFLWSVGKAYMEANFDPKTGEKRLFLK